MRSRFAKLVVARLAFTKSLMPLVKRMHSPERRAAIIREALRLFAERGFRGTTTRELAAAVGVSEPVLYEHFRTKRELYDAIIEVKSCEGPERLVALTGTAIHTGDDRGFFEGVASLMLDFYESNPDFVRLLMFSALESHEMGESFGQRYREVLLTAIGGYIDRRVREGAFRKLDSSLTARAFTGMVAHFGLHLVLFPTFVPKMDRKDLVRGMVDMFLQGVTRANRAPAKKRKR